MNKGDITKVNPKELNDIDVFVYSPPCQSFSVAGKQEGLRDPRGQLFYHALPIIQEKQPKYALMENVKGLTGKRFDSLFKDMLKELDLAGYNNYYQVLNAKDYGTPQNRERVFIVSIRKDIDNGEFQFSEPFDSGLRLRDVLEPQVNDRYYIQNESVDKLVNDLQKEDALNNKMICAQRGRYNSDGETKQQLEIQHSGLSNALTTVQKDNLVLEPSILRYERTEYGKEIRRQYEKGEIEEKIGNMRELKPRTDGISNTITTVQKDNLLIESNKLKFVGGINNKDWVGDGKQLSRNYPQGNRVYDPNGIACSQTAQGGGIGSYTGLYLERDTPSANERVIVEYKVRKLTPLECWRLMGFNDEDFDRAKQSLMDTYYNGNDRANSQLYKQAGNSVVTRVIEEIYKNLF